MSSSGYHSDDAEVVQGLPPESPWGSGIYYLLYVLLLILLLAACVLQHCFLCHHFSCLILLKVSYMILERVSPVTHSVGNCVKRVVVIVTSVLFFRTPVSPINSLGNLAASICFSLLLTD